MNWYKEIATNTLFQIIARLASSAGTFLITIIVARNLGVLGYGDFAKVNAFVSLFYLFTDLGLNAIFLQKEDAKLRFKELFYTRFVLSVVILCLVNCISYFLPYNSVTQIGFSPQVRLGITIFSFTLITEAMLYCSTAVFQRELSYEYFMISSVIGSFATLFFVFLMSIFSHSLFFVLGSYILGGILESGLALFFTKQSLFPVKVSIGFIKKLAIDTLPIALMLIFNLIYFRIDIIILSLYKSSQDVALYDLAYKFFDFLIALPLFLSNALYPSILREEKDQSNASRRIGKYLLIFIAFSFCVLIPAWIFAPMIGLIKKEFIGAAVPFRILLLSLPVFFATSILQWILIAKRKQMFLAIVYLVSAVINIGLNVIFIPKFSYNGASVITGISELLVFVILLFKVNLKLNERN